MKQMASAPNFLVLISIVGVVHNAAEDTTGVSDFEEAEAGRGVALDEQRALGGDGHIPSNIAQLWHTGGGLVHHVDGFLPERHFATKHDDVGIGMDVNWIMSAGDLYAVGLDEAEVGVDRITYAASTEIVNH